MMLPNWRLNRTRDSDDSETDQDEDFRSDDGMVPFVEIIEGEEHDGLDMIARYNTSELSIFLSGNELDERVTQALLDEGGGREEVAGPVLSTGDDASHPNLESSDKRHNHHMPSNQPALNYKDCLNMEFTGFSKLDIKDIQIFRNNIACASNKYNLLLVAGRSDISVFEYNGIDGTPNAKASLIFDTRPIVTTTSMTTGANWPVNPHGINFMKIVTLHDQEMLVTTGDDGRILLFSMDIIHDTIEQMFLDIQDRPSSDISRQNKRRPIKELLQLKVAKSAWGTDADNSRSLLAVSDNSRRVTVFFLENAFDGKQLSNGIRKVISPKLKKNIPDVQFVDKHNHNNPNSFFVACISISGQVAMWEFNVRPKGSMISQMIAYATTNSQYTDESMDDSVSEEDESSEQEPDDGLPDGRWVLRADLEQDGWTISWFEEKDFKQVETLFDATGNEWLKEAALFRQFDHENKKLLGYSPESYDPSIRFTTFDIETYPVQMHFHGDQSMQCPHYTSPICQDKQSKIRNYYKDRKDDPEKLLNPPFKNQFFVCTSEASLYLCRTEDMFCNASRANVFSWQSEYFTDETYFDRLSIVHPIPELSALIVVSQIGAVSLFRLTRYRGIFCMRQEYVFPMVEKFLFLGPRMRILVGVSVSPISYPGYPEDGSNRFRLTVSIEAVNFFYLSNRQLVYLDGFSMVYEISRKDSDLSLGDMIL